MRHLRCLVGLTAAMVLGLWQTTASAQSATGTVQQLGSNLYQYNVTLRNTSSTPIESFWFGWIPGYDLLPHIPGSVSAPTGWTGASMEEGIGGSSVLWTSPTGLQTGQSLAGFTFQTSDSPSVLEATSPFFFGLPADFSYTYSVVVPPEPQTGVGTLTPSAFVSVTPEPGCLLLLPAGLMLVRRRRSE